MLLEWILDLFADRLTAPPTPETRAYDAYKSAWTLRHDSHDLDQLLTRQFELNSVPVELADPDTEVGQQLFEWFREARPPRHVKKYLL